MRMKDCMVCVICKLQVYIKVVRVTNPGIFLLTLVFFFFWTSIHFSYYIFVICSYKDHLFDPFFTWVRPQGLMKINYDRKNLYLL